MADKQTCTKCDEIYASTFCDDCQQFLCDDCRDGHNSYFGPKKVHVLIPIEVLPYVTNLKREKTKLSEEIILLKAKLDAFQETHSTGKKEKEELKSKKYKKISHQYKSDLEKANLTIKTQEEKLKELETDNKTKTEALLQSESATQEAYAKIRSTTKALTVHCSPSLKQKKCPNGHSLTDAKTPNENYICDVCQSELPIDAPVHSCRSCNYDSCTDCIDKFKDSDDGSDRLLSLLLLLALAERDKPPEKVLKNPNVLENFQKIIGFTEISLLYNSKRSYKSNSSNSENAAKFWDRISGKPLLFLIFFGGSKQYVCGAVTSVPVFERSSDDKYQSDSSCYLFSLKHPDPSFPIKKFPVKQKEYTMWISKKNSNGGVIWGKNPSFPLAITFDSDVASGICGWSLSNEAVFGLPGTGLFGNSGRNQSIDRLKVFSYKK